MPNNGSDVSEGDVDDMHFFFYGIISMIPLGIILYNTIISSTSSYLFLGLYIGIFLLLYNFKSFSAGILLFILTIIPLYVICDFTKWFDYVIVGVITLVGIIMSIMTAGKSATNSADLDDSDERFILLFCFFGWILYSFGTAYYLMGNQILSQEWLSMPFIIFPFLLALCATSRLVTVILGGIGSIAYIFLNWNTNSFNFIKDWFGSLWRWIIDGIKWICSGIATIWMIQWSIYSVIGILLMVGIVLFIGSICRTRTNSRTIYIERDLLPMKYNGLSMTCPYCRRTMVKGEYRESTARGIAKATIKGLIGTGAVGSGAAIGGALGGPIAPLTALVGAAIGGAITYFQNKKIEIEINDVFNLWNYEVEGGRTVYFKCPLSECGHTWEETEHYGEIDH